MLKITVQLSDYFDEDKQEFVTDVFVLELEHSLVALSKWESKYEKPFYSKAEKSTEEVMNYIEAMIISPDYPPDILEKISQTNIEEITTYIYAKMTATWFNEPQTSQTSRKQITSELIYYWMASYQIPWEVERWHLNRLFTLIKVFDAENTKQKPRSRREVAEERQALNEQRRAQMGTTG